MLTSAGTAAGRTAAAPALPAPRAARWAASREWSRPARGSSTDPEAAAFPSADPELLAAFSPAALDDALGVAHEALAGYLRDERTMGVELPAPDDLRARAEALMVAPQGGRMDAQRLADVIDLYLSTAIHLRSTGYMARQFSSVIPVTAVFDMVTAMVPQPASFYEAGPLANVADKIMAAEFADLIGWPAGGFDMVSTSGGTLANLSALLAARNTYCHRKWGAGYGAGARLAVAAGADSHYSVARAAAIIGLPPEAIVTLPLNSRRQIDPDGAAAALAAARDSGLDVFAVVAAAGSTPTGAIDPLAQLAELARAEGAWLHVDAAHNGAFLVSDRLRARVSGLGEADSFCLDAHKTLFVPAAATLLFYRDPQAAQRAFTDQASYVFDDPADPWNGWDSGGKNLECTKRPAILNLWLVWTLYGRELLARKLEYLVDLTRDAADHINSQPDFTLTLAPESNILCFQHVPGPMPAQELNELQVAIRDGVRAQGRFLVSKVDLGPRTVLRMVLMNHQIEVEHVAAACDEIRRVAAGIRAAQ